MLNLQCFQTSTALRVHVAELITLAVVLAAQFYSPTHDADEDLPI